MADFPINVPATVVRVLAQDAEHLRYFDTLGLIPGALVMVREHVPFDGPLMIAVGDAVHTLDRTIARTILVRSTPSANALHP